MKLNLGSGNNKIQGFINVDKNPLCAPDMVLDLEELPWPWQDDSVDHIVFSHSLDYMGERPRTYIALWKEIWRVLRNGGIVEIVTVHPQSMLFHHDPLRLRAVTPEGISLFDKTENAKLGSVGPFTALAVQLGIDFSVVQVRYDLVEPWRTQVERGEISQLGVKDLIRARPDVCFQVAIMAMAYKTDRSAFA